MLCIGTAGWSIPAAPSAIGSRLHRYSRMLHCVEVNSSFYRPHRPGTWARWAAETPESFRFSIKAPRTITHEAKLHDTERLLREFLHQIQPLAHKAGPMLFQLPPSFAFDRALAEDFLALMRTLYHGEAALEPRHESWFSLETDALLKQHRIARVAADPAKGGPAAAHPGGDTRLAYWRLHGSPQTYYSNYDEAYLLAFAEKIKDHPNTWVIFDNTALGHALENALRLFALTDHPTRD